MPLNISKAEALKLLNKKYISISSFKKKNIAHATQQRNELVDSLMGYRNKVNYLAFAIVGSILALSPDSLNSFVVIIGISLLVFTAFILGYLQVENQTKLNIKNYEEGMDEIKKRVTPIQILRRNILTKLDTETDLSQKDYDEFNAEISKFVQWGETFPTMIAPKSKLSNLGHYMAWFGVSLVILGFGIANQYNRKINSFTTHLLSDMSRELSLENL